MMPSSGCILTEARVPAVCSLVQSEREGERDGDTEELMRLADYIWAGGGGGGGAGCRWPQFKCLLCEPGPVKFRKMV